MTGQWNLGNLVEPLSGRHWDVDTTHREISARVGAFLADGIEPGDRVLIHFGNNLEFFAELLAIWQLGACAIPVDARLTPFEVEKLSNAASARFAVVNDATPDASQNAAAGMVVRHSSDCKGAAGHALLASAWPRLDDDALILFTSGSTGDPKGVVHTHRSLLARWITLQQSLGVAAYRRTLCVLPTHFGHGLICNCLYPWLNGCDLFIAPPFQPELIMRLGTLIDEHDISFMSSVPSVWNLALKTAAPPQHGQLKRVHVGSAPLSANNWQQIQEWTGTQDVFNAYGITETGSWVAGTSGEAVVPESGLVGRPWGATIRVVEHGDDAEPPSLTRGCAAGQTGMVWLHTPALMKGYFQRPDLTDAAVHHGWFMTGDIGLIDDRGRLVLRGRERDEINKGGAKIYPSDIDAVARQCEGVRDVCAFGFADAVYGENVAMALVLEHDSPATHHRLNEWLGNHLATHKQPVRWYVLDEIPTTDRGKINRVAVMETCLQQQPLDPARLKQQPAN